MKKIESALISGMTDFTNLNDYILLANFLIVESVNV